MNNSTVYFYGYVVCSVVLTAWSVHDLLVTSSEYLVFLIEITTGIKLVVFLNALFLTIVVGSYGWIMALFGELRLLESQHLIEQVPLMLFNSLFNVTVSDGDVVLNCFLLGISAFLKCHHIIMIDRYDFIHVKMLNQICSEILMSRWQVLLTYGKCFYFWVLPATLALELMVAKMLAYNSFINLSTCLLFGFQIFIQGIDSCAYFCKTLIQLYEVVQYREVVSDDDIVDNNNVNDDLNEIDDLEVELVWEAKPYYTKTIDIVSSVFKAVSSLVVMYLLSVNSGPSSPISMLIGTYSSFSQAYKEITQFIHFLEASKKLDTLLKDALEDELNEGDNLCSICRDVMSCEVKTTRRKPKRLDCGHIIHMGCLKEWLEMSEVCPLCRRKVFISEEAHKEEERIREVRNQEQAIENTINEPRGPVIEDLYEGDPTGLEPEVPDAEPTLQGHDTTDIENLRMKLPDNALIPPYWSVLPLEKVADNDYKVFFSNKHQGTLKSTHEAHNGELTLLRGTPLQESSNGDGPRISLSNGTMDGVVRDLIRSNNDMKQRIMEMERMITEMKNGNESDRGQVEPRS